MTRTHYRLLAQAVSEARSRVADEEIASSVVDVVVNELCSVLKEENIRFDREKFEEACA